MKTQKLICAVLVLLMLTSALAACNDDKSSYADDKTVASVSDAIENCIVLEDGYINPDSDFLGFYFDGAAALIESYEICKASASDNINEFGVFHVKDGKADEMKAICVNYLETQMDRWIAQADYIYDEHPKMENSEVRVFGNYVVYTILTTSDKTAVFGTVEELLKQK